MRPEDLWHYLTGYVRIRVTGRGVERFVNLAAAQGHRLWRTRRGPRALEANVSLASFRRLRPAARRTGSRVRIIKKRGLPFVAGRASRRPLMVAGAVLSMVALYVLSSTIWVVRVEGTENIDPALLREVAANLGLRPGVMKMALDPGEIERGLLLAVHGLSWAAVELHGVVAVIKVVEKVPLVMPGFPEPPADIVAAKDGLVVKLIVLSGEAVVSEGSTVRKGDVLIIGRKPVGVPPPPAHPDEKPPPPPMGDVVAAGIVRARVWYQAYAEASLHTLSHEPTGRVWRTVALRVGDLTVPLYGWWTRPEGLYERRVERWTPPWWRTGEAPVEIIITRYVEVSGVRRDYSPSEAETLAREAALALLGQKLPEGVVPVAFDFEVTLKNDILIGVLATAETLEDIGETRERR